MSYIPPTAARPGACRAELLERRVHLAAGDLDPSFRGDGLFADDRITAITDLAVQADGKIVAAGRLGQTSFQDPSAMRMAIVRYDADGSTDTSFGEGGRAEVAFSEGRSEHSVSYFAEPHAPITRLLLQDDGKILALGHEFSDIAAARFTPDGRLDPTFKAPERFIPRPGQPGEPALDYGAAFVDGFLQDDGGVIIAASTFGTRRSLALARLTAGGSLDDSFGDGGVLFRELTPVNGRGVDVRAIAPFGDRRILAAGSFDSDDRHGYDQAALARLRLGDAEKPPTNPPTKPPAKPPTKPSPGKPADTDAPRARLKRGGVEQRAARARFRVVFSDQSAIDQSSLGDGDILVSSRGGYHAPARLERVFSQAGGRRLVAIFSFAAPGGSWDRRDSRVYTFRLAQDAVADSHDNATDEALIRHRRLEFT